jgi:hypothetical protein
VSKATGLEITSTHLRAVVADGSPKGWRVVSYAEAEIPPPAEGQDPKAAFAGAIVKFIADKRLPRGILVPSVEARNATIREVSLPFGSDDQLRKTVKFELESHVHDVEVDQVVVDFLRVDQKEKQTNLLAFAAHKKDVAARLEALATSKADPPAVDLDVAAVMNALLSGPASGIAAFVALHVSRGASFMFYSSGGPKLVRALPLSSTEPEFEAKASSEVCRTLLRVSGGHDLPEVLVSGDADDLPGLAKRIERDSGVAARCVELFPEGDFEGAARGKAAGGVALGLALKGLGVDRVGLDFRREEYTYERKTDQLKKAAAVFLCLVTGFFACAAAKCWQDRAFLQGRHGEILALQQKMFEELYPGEPKPSKPLEVLRSRKEMEQESKGGGAHPIPKSALEYWADLFGAIKVKNKFFIENMSISAAPGAPSVKLVGKADPAEEAEQIMVGVKALKPFANARPPAVTQDKTMWRFDIDIPIAPEDGK